jgi:hypothetical protein
MKSVRKNNGRVHNQRWKPECVSLCRRTTFCCKWKKKCVFEQYFVDHTICVYYHLKAEIKSFLMIYSFLKQTSLIFLKSKKCKLEKKFAQRKKKIRFWVTHWMLYFVCLPPLEAEFMGFTAIPFTYHIAFKPPVLCWTFGTLSASFFVFCPTRLFQKFLFANLCTHDVILQILHYKQRIFACPPAKLK